MPRLDVRRLAAVDMHGSVGVRWRRRVIVAEFVVGALGGIGIGLWIALSAHSAGWQVFGAWLTGVGVNYLALALHALSLSRPGALDTELADADIRADLRFYNVAQLWVLLPIALAVLALAQLGRSRRREAAPQKPHD